MEKENDCELKKNKVGMVSIIMPTWNSCTYIKEAIDSIIAQTYSNWELIIVDDASTDFTEDIVSSYDDERIYYYRNIENMGAAISRNKAIKMSRGEWIAFLDSDDLWHPQKLEKQLNFMKRNKYVFSYHNYEKIDEDDNRLGIFVTGPAIVTKRRMYNYGYPGCLTFMYNANYFGMIQIADIKKNNDYAILLQLCKKANCYLLNDNLAQYRVRKTSISHDKFYKKLRSHYDLFYICDKNSVALSIYYTFMNMIFGTIKKIRYERKIKN